MVRSCGVGILRLSMVCNIAPDTCIQKIKLARKYKLWELIRIASVRQF